MLYRDNGFLRRRLAPLLLLTGIGACQERPAHEPPQHTAAPADSRPRRLQQLLALYPDVRLPLELSTEGKDTLLMAALPGEQLVPDDLVALLGSGINSGHNDVFAIGKLALAPQRLGLFTRVPGTYDSSTIKLLVLNEQTGRVEAAHEMAETFGDAGDVYVRTTTVSRPAAGALRFEAALVRCWALDEELTRNKCVDSSFVYKLVGNELQLVRKQKGKEY